MTVEGVAITRRRRGKGLRSRRAKERKRAVSFELERLRRERRGARRGPRRQTGGRTRTSLRC